MEEAIYKLLGWTPEATKDAYEFLYKTWEENGGVRSTGLSE
jgi:hypothetical protein